MLRPYGIHITAFNAYVEACAEAGINPNNRIMQTIGTATASAGTHGKDGTFKLILPDGSIKWTEYAACTDIRTKDLSDNEAISLIRMMAKRGHCAYFRCKGSFTNNQHIHTIWSGCKIKNPVVRRQVRDFLVGKDGLKNHKPDWYWGKEENKIGKITEHLIRTNFLKYNPNIYSIDEDIEEDESHYECGCCLNHVVQPDEIQGLDIID